MRRAPHWDAGARSGITPTEFEALHVLARAMVLRALLGPALTLALMLLALVLRALALTRQALPFAAPLPSRLSAQQADHRQVRTCPVQLVETSQRLPDEQVMVDARGRRRGAQRAFVAREVDIEVAHQGGLPKKEPPHLDIDAQLFADLSTECGIRCVRVRSSATGHPEHRKM